MRKDQIKEAGNLEARKILIEELEARLSTLRKEEKATDCQNLTHEDHPHREKVNPENHLDWVSGTRLTDFEARAKVNLGRSLRILGKIRLEDTGKKHIDTFLGEDAIALERVRELGEKLDRGGKKLVQIVRASKNTPLRQEKSTVIPKPQTFGIYLKFPKAKVMAKLQKKGIVDARFRPIALKKILMADDIVIISYFNGLARGLLNYYAPSNNF
jgi:hypothetical protein